jgi:hypothetical protein
MVLMPDSQRGIRLGLVPCPICKNIPLRRSTCEACDKAGMLPVDKAIEIGLLSDTERELKAVKEETKGEGTDGKT